MNVVGGEFNFVFGGVTFHYTGVPEDGTYRVARMREDLLGAGSEYGISCGADLDRNGVCGNFFAMLWRTTDNKVLVDSDNDLSFADQSFMTDYKVNYDIGHFGHDNPATPVQRVGPVRCPDRSRRARVRRHRHRFRCPRNACLGHRCRQQPVRRPDERRGSRGEDRHGSRCLFTAGCTAHALTEGMIYLIETDHVDVVNMSIGGLPALNDGNNTRGILYNRLIEDNDVQMFISAGNDGPGTNTIGDPGVVSKVMGVGAYIHKDTWRRNYGSDSQYADNLHPFSSRGPAEDGALKPQIVAPGAAISSVPLWQNGQPVGGTYTLPPGYGMFNGTSMASPQAAGAAALLISAAKQDHHTPDYGAAELRTVFNSTARFLDRYTAADQGNGLIDVDKAWKLLKKGVDPVNIKSRVAVHTLLSDFLDEPGFGPGIYDREGVTVGQRYTRTYTFTRTSGPNRQENYKLKWEGNDGTFSDRSHHQVGPEPAEDARRGRSTRGRAGSTRRSCSCRTVATRSPTRR